MQKTGLKTRLLALVLCFLMVFTSVPTAAFAAEAEPSATPVTEAPTEEPTEVPTEEPTEAPTETPTEVPTEAPAAGISEDPAATTTPAADATVYVTVSKEGTLATVNTSVTVKDLNSDGVLTYDEAMRALHADKCPGGYEVTESDFGAFVTKLWGVANGGSYLFFKNGTPLSYAVDSTESTVAAGDQLYAAVLKNASSYDDWYTSFDKRTASVETGEELTLTLTGFLGMGYTAEQLTPSAISGVQVGTWAGGVFTALEGKTTDTDGKVTLSFDKAGTYIVSAQGSTAAGNAIMAPVCVVTVEGSTTDPSEPEEPAESLGVIFTCGDKKFALNFEESKAEYTVMLEDMPNAKLMVTGAKSGDMVTLDGEAIPEGGKEYTLSTTATTILLKVNDTAYTLYVTNTVNYKLSSLTLWKNQTYYNNGDDPIAYEPAFDPDVYEYTTSVPDHVYARMNIYGLRVMTDVIPTPSEVITYKYSGSWGVGNVGRTDETGHIERYISPYQGTVSIKLDGSENTYKIKVNQYATLKALTIDGIADQTFDKDITTYSAYADSTKDGIAITATGYKTTYTITINGEEATNGSSYTLPYSWDANGEMKVEIQVSASGMESFTYTVNLKKMPREDAPYIISQSSEADYTVIDTASYVQDLFVVASANGELTYQWFYNITASTEGGTAIADATASTYTPPITEEVIGTRYYYCQITNTGAKTGNVTYSTPTRVTVDPDPTPVATILNPGMALEGYSWDVGYVYDLDAEAIPLEGSYTVAEGVEGKITFSWSRRKDAYTGAGIYSAGTNPTEKTLTPMTDISVTNDTGWYYYLDVVNEFKGRNYSAHATTGKTYTDASNKTYDVLGVYVFVKVTEASTPVITTQPVGATYFVGDSITKLSVSATIADGGTKKFQWYVNDQPTTEGATALEGQTKANLTLGTATEASTKYYYCVVSNTLQGLVSETVSDFAEIKIRSTESMIAEKLTGTGTEEDPYVIATAKDYQSVAQLVAEKVSFDGKYLKQTADIELPGGWEGIGCLIDPSISHINAGKNMAAFSGTLDGGGHTITIPEGGLPLFGYVKGATVKNLNIFGKKIAGYGLVNHLEGVSLSGNAIIIDNVTLKSGSATEKAGFIGTYITNNGYAGCSAGFTVTIRNSTIEKDVVIGYNADQKMIGSFAGRVHGTIENCVSYATVKGTDYVGGILGTVDNAMGVCAVRNSQFYGTVEASGEHAGGILGGGYENSTAPNGVVPTIVNCTVKGSVTGKDKVGGILGGDSFVAQSWGSWTMTGNTFSGTVKATGGTYVGGIVGYLLSMNKFTGISDNYYTTDSVDHAIGFVKYLDTNFENPVAFEGTVVFDTSKGIDACPTVAGCSWRKDHNRTDDPLGTDADKLCKKIGAENPEEPAKHYLSALAAGSNTTATDLTLADGQWAYTTEVSPSYGMFIKVKATLSEDAPEGATITAKYTTTAGKETTTTMNSGTASSLWSVVTFGMQGSVISLEVGVEGDYQTYTVNIDRPAEVTVKSVTDVNDAALPVYESQYLVPEGETSVKLTANSNGADLTINGQTATSGEAFELTPAWSEDNTCTVTIAATYGEKSSQQVITLKKLFATDEFTGSCGENITWKLVNGKLTLTGSGEMTNYKKEDVPWYSFMNRIHTVEIGEGITSVGKYAFKAATNLSKVTLPSTLTAIGEECFNGCLALKEVTLPDGLKTLSGRAFCKTGLTSISIPASVDSVSYYVFNGCTELKTATVTNAMGTDMFSDCLQLESITFAGTSLTSIPSCAIANCIAMKNLVIPEGVTSIAKQSGSNLQSYVQNVTLPNSLTTIATGAFSTELVNVTIKDDNPNFVKDGKILYTKDYKAMVLCEQDISGEVTFHDGLESIPASAFASNKNITKVTLPDTVKTIGKNAFNGCTKLETVVLNEGLESFGENAFYNCYALASINLPSSLTSLGKMAFYACNSLKTIEIPEKITALPNLLFSNAKGLETIILPAGLTRMEARTFFNCENTLKTIYFRGAAAAWNAVVNRPADGVYEVVYNYGRTDIAAIETQPQDRFFVIGTDADKALSVTVTKPEGVGVSFAWYVNDSKSSVGGTKLEEGVSVSEDGLTSYCTPDTAGSGIKYYYCIVTSTLKDEVLETNSRIATVEVSAKLWEGEGTEKDPFKLATAEDLQKLYTYVENGSTTSGKYFAVTGDITLPEGWTPIGTSENRFAGTINGRIDDQTNATIIVPEGGKPLLGYVINATVKNLNIKGTKIDGYGLIDNFVGINITSETVIENVTIKSGTRILNSGLLGTYTTTNIYAGCSATYQATIRNCTVEKDVIIGYNKDQSKIGSLAGRFIGSVENCVSYATVYGKDYVGGLVGNQDNAMGACLITGSQFHGTVEGSGQFAGGIIGGGYEDGTLASAPSGLQPTIKSCSVDGTVKGNSAVGGISGGDRLVAQSWNGNTIVANTFTGTISGKTYVGGIIGYIRSLNKLNNISDNSYSGAERGIGYVAYLDTDYENPTAFEDTLVFNTGKGTTQCPTVQWHTWKANHNRSDDPLGNDADKLCKKLSTEEPVKPVIYEIQVSGTYKTEYTVGDELDLTGIKLTAKWTAGKADTTLSLSDVTISGYDKDQTGPQTVILTYGTIKAEINVTVAPKSTKITVNVSILGDSKHGADGGTHGLAMGGLTSWASEQNFEADANETVWGVLQRVFKKYGMSVDADSNNAYGTVYIKSINGLGEFDNGDLSGWMFTVNGKHPVVGVAATYVKQGDNIILHYTDDYTVEEGSKPVEDDQSAEAVDDLIEKIGTVTLTDSCKQKIDAARKAYNALSAANKKKVKKLSALETAEKQYAALKQADDEKAAKAVIDLINKIDKDITADSEKAIKAARAAYDQLTAAQKALVTNYKTLTNSETALAKIQATEADKKKAEEVSKQIDKLGNVTLDSEKDIESARKAYDALTDLQKKLVENVETLEKAEAKLAELKQAQEILDAYKATGDYMINLGTPGIGSVGGEWMVIGLARSDRNIPNVEDYYNSVVKYVQEHIDENERLHKAKSTDNSRMILALTAIGKDVTDVDGHNLLVGLNSTDYIKKQGNNGPIWALIALDSGNYPVPEGDVTRKALIDEILSVQTSDGGWAISGDEADADMIGMALTALAPYYKKDLNVLAAVDKAIECLSQMQDADGGFSTFSGDGGKVATSESTAQVIVALTALGINPDTDSRFIKNGKSAIDALTAYFVDGGGFKHIMSGERDGMATEQAYYALTAYYRFLEEKTRLYDMTDVIDMGGDPEEIVAETTEPTVPATTEPVEVKAEKASFAWWTIILVLAAGVVIVAVMVMIPKRKKKNG